MNKLKLLQETKGGLVKQVREIIDLAHTEKRAITSEEHEKLSGIEGEIDGHDKTIDAEMRQMARESKNSPVLTRGEQRDINRFDLGKILRKLNQGGGSQPLDGIEAEMIQTGEAEARSAGLSINGLALPQVLLFGKESRAALDTGTGAGEELIATNKNGLLGDFYNSSVLERNGAMVLNGLQGNVDLPRYIKGTDPVKKAENDVAGDAGGTFTDLNLTPQRLPAFIEISDQLLLQSSSVLETFIGGQLRTQLNAVKEVAFFHGGGTLEPTGIAATAGIGSVVGGTNGAAPDWDDIVDLETAVAVDNALDGQLRYFSNSAIRGKLKKTLNTASTDSVKVWDVRTPEAPLNGYATSITNAVSSTLTKGTESGTASAIFFGNAADFVVGYWGGLMLEMVRDTVGAKAGKRTLVANSYYDAGVLRAQSFSAMLDALPA